jgi:hypothetical protein
MPKRKSSQYPLGKRPGAREMNFDFPVVRPIAEVSRLNIKFY